MRNTCFLHVMAMFLDSYSYGITGLQLSSDHLRTKLQAPQSIAITMSAFCGENNLHEQIIVLCCVSVNYLLIINGS